MLIIVLILGLLLVTPTIALKAQEFSVEGKKDNSIFTANLVIRIL
jgi:hypothetical protein